jgi:hypothetical protein
MHGDKVYCLMFSGPGLTDNIRNILFDTAQEMVRKNKKKQKVEGENFEGQVTTLNKVIVNGGVTGMLFNAMIETEKASRVVSYMIRPTDLRSQDGSWDVFDPPHFDPSMN